MKRRLLFGTATLACALLIAHPANATDFTLSDSAIMSLDYNLSNSYAPPLTATIVSEQDIAVPGVQFSVHFASTNSLDRVIFNVSHSQYGAGTLVGMDVSAYSNFSLAFTLLSIDGSASGGRELIVGSLIGPWKGSTWAFHPQFLTLAGFYPSSGVSTTSVTTASVSVIGFTVYFNDDWGAGPHDVTFIVAPAAGAVQIPEPAGRGLVGLGLLAVVPVVLTRRKTPLP